MPTMPQAQRRPAPRKVGRATLRCLTDQDAQARYRWRLEWFLEGGKGKMLSRSLGWQTPAQAERAAAQIVADGLPTSKPDKDSGTCETVADLLEFWLGDLEERPPERMKQTTRDLRFWTCEKRIKPLIGALVLSRFDATAIARYGQDRRKAGAAPRTIDLELRTVRAAWRWGRPLGLTPNRDITIPALNEATTKPVNSRRTPTAVEVEAVVNACRHAPTRLAIVLMWCTGARVGEVAGATWEDYDEAGSRLRFDAKTGERWVPLVRRAVEALGPSQGRTGPILGMRAASIASGLERAVVRAGVAHFSCHGLRRLAVGSMIRAGVDPKTAATVTGHSVVTMLRTYYTPTDLDRASAVALAGLGVVPEGAVIPLPTHHSRSQKKA